MSVIQKPDSNIIFNNFEAALFLGISRTSLKQYAYLGKIPVASHKGNTNLYRLDDLMKYKEQCMEPHRPKIEKSEYAARFESMYGHDSFAFFISMLNKRRPKKDFLRELGMGHESYRWWKARIEASYEPIKTLASKKTK